MADRQVEDRDTTWARTAKDLFSGAAGGVAQVLLGMYFRCSWSVEVGQLPFSERDEIHYDTDIVPSCQLYT